MLKNLAVFNIAILNCRITDTTIQFYGMENCV